MVEKKQVAIIGAGIVGSTAAYYLSKEEDLLVSIFDFGQGQATKAAVSVRNLVFPKVTGINPFSMAKLISFVEKSPSGPIKIVIFSFLVISF